ncbi:MAG: hypothetical protein JSV19_03855 [Phycisphaerales bacterium]|nr:MAG: hypothetical protein JSV19_03855 [Phycisphaerales bacterium]
MTSSRSDSPSLARVCLAGLVSWLLPGLGHIVTGHRARGLILLICITVTFWGGIAIGGVQDTVDPQKRFPWFMAQVCTGTHGMVAYSWAERLRARPDHAEHTNPSFESINVAVVYTGIAGLLNLLVILDAIGRADRPPEPLGLRANATAAAPATKQGMT